MMAVNKIYPGDALKVLKTFADKSIHCIVTSPPYYGLRNYGVSGQLGLEALPQAYVRKMVLIFREAKRVLRNDGTLWLNMGDSYAGRMNGQQKGSNTNWVHKSMSASSIEGIGNYEFSKQQKSKRGRNVNGVSRWGGGNIPASGDIKAKDLIGIPWTLALALRKDGWYLRQDIIWNKPNPMPESVTDRCTKSHEYIFLLSKSPRYYYDIDAIRTPVKDSTVKRMMQQIEDQKGSDIVPGKTNGAMKAVGPGRMSRNGIDIKGGNQGSESGIKAYAHRGAGDKKLTGHSGNFDAYDNLIGSGMANKKSVWTVTTKPYFNAHFATFPQDLIVDCIKAGCAENGIVLDPFMGAGTTALVARKLNRNFIGIELNPAYIKMAEKRLKKELGMFL